ncbi:heavy-metal-associated domain-containing protein [Thermus scotoductus]|uniref:HMA domain-containing protein n=1 Tax=Thermus scotoductus TaxID=37636 RepID=A0A430UTW8_THESC|nr:heavy-metal-associated domain-containing protein [Thermus scotoductus]RTI12173.1 hypothetical protein CSW27_10825 [Thermus scotoductus]RTI12435.1 hypothetical protein CSW30_01055 [Thermus scotoductus]
MVLHFDRLRHLERLGKPLDLEALLGGSSVYLSLSGLDCGNCAARVREALLSLDGVWLVRVFLWERVALVAFDPERVEVGQLLAAVAEAANDGIHSFRAEVKETRLARETLRISGGKPWWSWPAPCPSDCPGAWS